MSESMEDVHILIVDDEESIRVTFEMFLKREGYGKVTTAATIEEALVAINEEHFDLIISDIVLEGACGTDLLKYIQQTGVQCPVVMITGFPNLNSAAEAVRYGAFEYISKPVNKETLLRIVRQALKHWQLAKEKQELQRENEKFRRYLEVIFSSVSDAIITVDEAMRIIQVNDTARTWMAEVHGDEVTDLQSLPGEMGMACLQDASRVIKEGQVVREHQVECRKADGTIRMISLTAAPLKDAVEEFNGAVIVARDISLGLPESHGGLRSRFHGFIGISPQMQEVYRLIENVGKVDTSVLITGESGTGKELAAEALHAESWRCDRPLVKVDCAAMAEDLLESELFGHRKGAFTGANRNRPGRLLQADHGTLFLDEIGDISSRMQLRLLRFLQEQTFTPVGQDTPLQVDVRVIAATNVDLREKVRQGLFREDLYYRLKVVEIMLPPLRERRQCIPLLVHHFLALFREKLGRRIHTISDQALDALTRYPWPGNVRELRHVMERACILCTGSTLRRENLPVDLVGISEKTSSDTLRQPGSATPSSQQFVPAAATDQEMVQQALLQSGGNKSLAAKLLHIDRSTLYRKMKRYRLV
ncbi:MAG: sigma-54-dependent Fis family transcriptional regulator [Desulfoprunum sp.]|uniref:sigma-54 dependent transcriptional regulator n=1 Tax=Desulfoprunum sp. TaxID=2020866 RepID=UPI003C73E255